MKLLYRIAVAFYHFAIHLAALFNPKAKAWVDGRKNNSQNLQIWRQQLPKSTAIVWMHCASLGEFEQGRPVLERIKKDHPTLKIVLTFYSPSGYEQRKHYSGADWVGYLPADGKKRAQQWINILQPQLAIFVKYEFWINHLSSLFNANIPTFLIAASFRPDQLFFKSYGAFFRKTLARFQHIFTQSASDLKLLESINMSTASVAGDPRVDRVLSIASTPKDFTKINTFKQNEHLLIAGSSWKPDETILLNNQQLWTKDWKLILVPHEIDETHIQQIISQINIDYVRYSTIDTTTDLAAARILIVDTIGMLSHLYRYGDLAYIGGGFGVSIHNTLEPAAFNLPVIIGPKYKKFPEAVTLVERKGFFVINNKNDFASQFSLLNHETHRNNASEIVETYMKENKGATTTIVKNLLGVLNDLT